MSDADVVRLLPVYRDVKEMRSAIMGGSGVFNYAVALEGLVEQAIMTDGQVVKVQAEIAVNNVLIHARLVVEGAERIKAALAEVAS